MKIAGCCCPSEAHFVPSSSTMCTLNYEKSSEPALIVKFTNGELQEPNDKIKFKLYGKLDGSYAHKRILVASSDKHDYVGQTFGTNATKCSSICKYYIGVLNKKTGKMQVKDATFICLNPKLNANEEDEMNETKADLSFRERSDMLTAAFGSRQKKRALNSRLKFDVKSEDVESVLNKSLNETVLSPEDQKKLMATPESSDIIPPINMSAKSEENVFNIHDLISQSELDAIPDEDINLLSDAKTENMKQWLSDNTFSGFVIKQLPKLPMNKVERKEKARLLVYTEYLFTLLKINSFVFMKKKDPLPEHIPLVIRRQMLERFTEFSNGNRSMPSTMKDKICIHIIVMALLTGDFRVQLNEIQPDLKLNSDKLRNFLRALCLRMESTKNSTDKVALLKLPLSKPSFGKMPRRRRL